MFLALHIVGNLSTRALNDWPMFGYDNSHSKNSNAIGLSEGNILWEKIIDDDIRSSPAVKDNNVYVGSDDNKLYCFSALGGTIIWSYETNGDIRSSPAIYENKIYVGSGDKRIYCINAEDGTLIWSYKTNGYVYSSPNVIDDRVFVGSNDKYVYCLDASTGTLIWRYRTWGKVMSSPALNYGRVYVGSDDNRLYCLDAQDGSFLWNFWTWRNIRSSPTVVDNKVYFGSYDRRVYCLDAMDGSYLWSYQTAGSVYSSPSVSNGKLFIGSNDNRVYCLDSSDGAFIWKYRTGSDVLSSPGVAGNKLYVGSEDGKIYCLYTSDGSKVWEYDSGDSIYTSPALTNNIVYIGTKCEEAKLYCFGETITATISPKSSSIFLGESILLNTNVEGGVPPYQYEWFVNGEKIDGLSTNFWNFEPSNVGQYEVQVKISDSLNKVKYNETSIISVVELGELTVNIDPDSQIIYTGSIVSFISSTNGGLDPYNHQWFINDTEVLGATESTFEFSSTNIGQYNIRVVVTDSLSNKATSQISVVDVIEVATELEPENSEIYLGESKVFTATPSGGVEPYSYKWYLDGNIIQGAISSTWSFTPSTIGTYDVKVEVFDYNDVMAEATVTAKVYNLEISLSPESCTIYAGEFQTINAHTSGGVEPYSYEWYINNNLKNGTAVSNLLFNPSTSGTYNVKAKAIDANYRTITSASTTVTVLNVQVQINPVSYSLYLGESVILTALPSGGVEPYVYQWYLDNIPVTGATSNTWNFTPSTSGEYEVKVDAYDINGKNATSLPTTITVTELEDLSIYVSPEISNVYIGDSILFTTTASGGLAPYEYQWFVNDTPLTGANSVTYQFSPTYTGIYKVKVSIYDTFGQTKTSEESVVTVYDLSIDVTPDSHSMYLGQSIGLTATATGGLEPYSYQWYLNNNLIPGATANTYNFQPSTEGTYQLKVQVTDSNNENKESQQSTISVLKLDELSANINPDSYLSYLTESLELETIASGGFAPYTYQWLVNGIPQPGATNPNWTFTPTETGTFSIEVKITDTLLNQFTSLPTTITVTELRVNTSPDSHSMYLGQSIGLTATATGGLEPYSYQWYLNNNLIPGATANTYNFQPSTEGTYQLKVQVTDSNNENKESQQSTISVIELLEFSVEISPISEEAYLGDSTQFYSNIIGGLAPYTYQWLVNGIPQPGATNPNWTFTPTETGTFSIRVRATDSILETINSDIASIKVYNLSAKITPENKNVNVGEVIELSANANHGKNPYSYQWYLDNSPISGAIYETWTYIPTQSGTHNIKVDVTDYNGISSTSQTTVYATQRIVGGTTYSKNQKTLNNYSMKDLFYYIIIYLK